MKDLKRITITNLIKLDAGNHDAEIFEIAKKNTDYSKYEKVVKDVLEYLAKEKKNIGENLINL